MTDIVEGTFQVTSWAEAPTSELEGTAKVTTARIGQRFSGGIEADTVADMVMTYRPDGTADFVGHHRVLGSVGALSGSFVLRAIGHYDGQIAHIGFEVVHGTGTGDLEGLTGTGRTAPGHGGAGAYSFELELPPPV